MVVLWSQVTCDICAQVTCDIFLRSVLCLCAHVGDLEHVLSYIYVCDNKLKIHRAVVVVNSEKFYRNSRPRSFPFHPSYNKNVRASLLRVVGCCLFLFLVFLFFLKRRWWWWWLWWMFIKQNKTKTKQQNVTTLHRVVQQLGTGRDTSELRSQCQCQLQVVDELRGKIQAQVTHT